MAYRTGVSTSRGLSSLADHVGVSPVPLFDRVLRGGAALEIGCGEGRALLELQQRHPATRYRDAVAPAAPPPSPAGCGGGAVESPLARRIKRLFKKKRGRGAKAAEPPKPPSCREQLARKKASKRAQQEAGEGPVFRQAYLDAVGVWMDAATG